MASTLKLGRRGLLGALAGVAGAGAAQAQPRDPVAAMWQGIELEGQDGRTFQISNLRAPVTLVHLWANWCSACLGEMASLSAAAAALGGKAELVFVSHPQFWRADQSFAQRRGLPFRLATPSGANAPAVLEQALLDNGAYVVPRTMVFGADGRDTLLNHLGAVSWSSPAQAARLRTLVSG